jgi:FixJ family two-component response regulator
VIYLPKHVSTSSIAILFTCEVSYGFLSSQQPQPIVAVVEDDAALRKALGRLLRAGGFEPLLFESAEEFIQKATPAVQCIVLDVCLPGMSGLELLEQLDGPCTNLPVVLMTAGHDPVITERARKSKCAAFFLKPFDGHALIATITSLVTARAEGDHTASIS